MPSSASAALLSSSLPNLAPWLGSSDPVIGVLSLLPLPGALPWEGNAEALLARAEQDAMALATGGVDAILVENTWGGYSLTSPLDSAAIALYSKAIQHISQLTHKPVGVSVLPNDAKTALALAWASGACFIRVPVLVGCQSSPQGMMSGQYDALLRAYQQWGVPNGAMAVLADVVLPADCDSTTLPQAMVDSVEELGRVLAQSMNGAPMPFGLGLLVLQQDGVDATLLEHITTVTGCPVVLKASNNPVDPIGCAKLACHSSGVLLGEVLRKEATASRLYAGIDVTHLEHWCRGLHQTLQARSAEEATCLVSTP